MAVIHILDKHTAELIAAGEVVERPASVVKELTENAIDAGAHNITVSIERGGIACIQITDDGTGIEPEYIATAFVRHATSKLQTAEELDNIHTLGFRGEALASIASVARVELLTKTPDAEYACLYHIHGGDEQGLEPAARPVGTTITVRDLFYNTPARMKFLKKDASEGNFVSDVVMRLALSHPEIAFKFIREGKVQFQTTGDGTLRGAAYAVLSRDFAHDLLEVSYTDEPYCVTGLVTPPKSARASRAMQHFFINGRYVKNRTMLAALEAAYKGVTMQGKYPGCILNLQLPAQLVDVNVHPAKTEVRFAQEKAVFDIVYKAVKTLLMTPQSTERTMTFASQKPQTTSTPMSTPTPIVQAPVAPAVQRTQQTSTPRVATPAVEQITAYNTNIQTLAASTAAPYRTDCTSMPVPTVEQVPPQTPVAETPIKPVMPVAPVVPQEPEQVQAQSETQDEEQPQVEQTELGISTQASQSTPLRFVGEVFHTYIIAQRNSDICFIDKHAAHERLIYEELAQSYGSVSSQMLLCPVTVQLSGEEKNALTQYASVIADSGIEVEEFGGNCVIVRAVPADVVPEDIENLVVEMASRLVTNPRETISEKTEWVLHSIACRAAIKAGDKTQVAQLLHLAQQVLEEKIPPFCPHGRPIILKLTQKELEKQFGRQG